MLMLLMCCLFRKDGLSIVYHVLILYLKYLLYGLVVIGTHVLVSIRLLVQIT